MSLISTCAKATWNTKVFGFGFGIATIVVLSPFVAIGQARVAGLPVSLNIHDRPLSEALDSISKKAGLPFSYNPEKIQARRRITYSCTNKPLSRVLDELSPLAGIDFEYIENQIVIRPSKSRDNPLPQSTLHGFVKDRSNGEALIGANIAIPALGLGAISNGFGFFSITVPAGSYTVTYSFIGYEKYSATTELGGNTSVDIALQEASPLLKEVIIDATDDVVGNIQTGELNMKPRAVEERPALFGETDVIKSLESIPGVKLNSDGSTFYYVRGGNRDQNLVLVDDAPIYNPSHMLGLFSTIIPDVVNDISFYKGNTPASLGGRISSVLDIRTKKGNDQHLQAWGSAGVISTKLGIEGPLKKNKSSFLISARASRLKWFFHLLDRNISQFNFYDVTAKANFLLSPKDRIFFSTYNGSDNYIINNAGISWTNSAATFRWNHTINDRLFVNTTMAASNYNYSLYTDVAAQTRWVSHISNFTVKTDLSYFIKPENEVTFGGALSGYNFNPGNFQDPTGVSPFPTVSTKNSAEIVLYGNHEVMLDTHWGLNYGLRFSSWTDTGPAFEILYDKNRNPIDTATYKKGHNYKNYPNAEPRATLTYVINEQSSFKIGFARNAQNIHLISNSVSPFTSLEVWLPSSFNIKPQIANQATFGYYHLLRNAGIVLEGETFYKKMFHQIDYVPHAETLLNPLIESQLAFGTAVAYGIELLAKKDVGRLRGLASYTYSRAKRTFADLNQGKVFNAFADRPNQISIMIAYDVSLRWNIGANWNYSTGSPYSSPTSFYKYNDQEVPVYGQKNNDRLPSYRRMDVSGTFKLNKNPERKFVHSLTLSVFNFFGRKNALYINYNKIQDPSGDIKVPANLLDANRITSNLYLFGFTPSVSYNFKWL